MGSESIAHEAEGRMGCWLRGHEGERNNCFSEIQLVGQKNIETKHLSLVKASVTLPGPRLIKTQTYTGQDPHGTRFIFTLKL